MTLTLTAVNHKDLCHGWAWTIQDEDALAERVARVALGQYRHVAKILTGAGVAAPSTTLDHAKDAIQKLTVAPGDKPWHRDGWIFQTISWIAAHNQSQNAAIGLPHIRMADKGFDGIQLELSTDGKSVTAMIIFEDKATDNARKTIKSEVWPGIAALEANQRVTELTQDTSAILEAQQRLIPELDVDLAIDKIVWRDVRRYRVSITVGDTHLKPTARARLFKGFDDTAPGDIERRRAETIYIPQLRTWMESFAQRAIAHVKTISGHV